MSNAVFPKLHGLSFRIKKSAIYKALVQSAAIPGYEVRVPLGWDPIWRFQLDYTILQDDQVSGTLKLLEGFFHARRGSWDSFLLDVGQVTGNAADSSTTGELLTVDINNCAPVVHQVGQSGYQEAIYELQGTGINVQAAGTPLAAGTDFNLITPGQAAAGVLNANGITYSGYVLQFLHSVTAPITADFAWYYRVRFEADTLDFDMFHYLLWQAQQVNLIQTRS